MSDRPIKLRKSRSVRKKCRHDFVRVYGVHSWKYQCNKCGAFCR